MQIKLKNIGIVKDSEILLDGLTVITGKNNSGKTTVGKTLYALLNAVCDIPQKALADRNSYICQRLDEVRNSLKLLVRGARSDDFSAYPSIMTMLSVPPQYYHYHHRLAFAQNWYERFAHTLADEISKIDLSNFAENEKSSIPHYFRLKSDGTEVTRLDELNIQRGCVLSLLDELIRDLEKDPELVDYTRENINQTLRVEFANQIQPIRGQQGASQIELSGGGRIYFRISVSQDNIVNDGSPVFFSSPYEKVYLVDDPFILDGGAVRFPQETDTDNFASVLDPNRIKSHNQKLISVLRNKKTLSVFAQTVLDDTLKEVKAKINDIIPGTFDFSEEGEYYVLNGRKLQASNLATGSKMMSIVKILLDKGEIDNTTMLILDEPEAHLHPEWQNAFAEIIVLLVKELGVSVLLTTHSPNFMLALDAFMRKYRIAEKTNFYQTEMMEDDFVQFRCVNDDMGRIYQDFLQYLSEVKMLRSQYLNGGED